MKTQRIDLSHTPTETLQDKFDTDSFGTVEGFLKTGETPYWSGNYSLLISDCDACCDTVLTVDNGWLYSTNYSPTHVVDLITSGKPFVFDPKYASGNKDMRDSEPEGKLLPGKGKSHLLARNGDLGEEGELLEFEDETLYGPTFSFRCLGRFLITPKGVNPNRAFNLAVRTALDNQTITLCDFTPDARLKAEAKVRRAVTQHGLQAARERYRSPKPGFTLMDSGVAEWHRPSTAIFYVPKTKTTVILGMDDNSYFGCEVAGRFETVADALLALAPPEVRDRKGLKSGVLRQGEWFAIPCSDKEVPTRQTCACYTNSDVMLPVDNDGSNEHELGASDLRVGKNGIVYAKGFHLEHDEHGTLRGDDKWYRFQHNMAIRSFSEAGVD